MTESNASGTSGTGGTSAQSSPADTKFESEHKAELAKGADPEGKIRLDEVRITYYAATAKTSDIVRQLAFAGIAFIWVFSGGNVVSTSHGHLTVPSDLENAGICFVVALVLDLIQYAYRSAAFGIAQWSREREEDRDEEKRGKKYELPRPINYPTLACFWLKVAAIVVGYGLLAFGIAAKVN
jgi:hypothetical protein